MPLTDYAATPGGSLKLKGGAATNGKITKHKKKKKKPPPEQQAPQNKSSGPTSTSTDTLAAALDRASERKTSEGEGEQDTEYTEAGPEGERDAVVVYGAGKTEAERRHEETRKRRVSLSIFPALFPPLLVLLTTLSTISTSGLPKRWLSGGGRSSKSGRGSGLG